MTSPGPRYCPGCGTARVADMPFCPGCGLDLAALGDPASGGVGGTGATSRAPAPSHAGPTTAGATTFLPPTAPQSALVEEWEAPRASLGRSATSTRSRSARGVRVPPFVIVALLVAVGLVALGLLRLPDLGSSARSGGALPTLGLGQTPGAAAQTMPGAATQAPVAPIVGLTILSPSDGQAVGSKDVLIIGAAPPGVTITRDISFGLDQHATVDGTGHWAIQVGLNEGDNKLTFRIGDDHSTERTIRIIYQPSRPQLDPTSQPGSS